MKYNKNGSNGNGKASKAAKISAGIALGAGLIAAIAGTYYLYGSKDSKKHREKLKGWMLKARGEVLEKVESMKNLNEEAYRAVVDRVINRYKTLKHVNVGEVMALGASLKRHWSEVKNEVGRTANSSKNGTRQRTKRNSRRKNTTKSRMSSSSGGASAEA
jgi:hypothetical protein